MGDLISRSQSLKMLYDNKVKREDAFGNTRQLIAMNIDRLIEYVENMPDAYDVGKVVECIVRNIAVYIQKFLDILRRTMILILAIGFSATLSILAATGTMRNKK